MPAPAYTPDLAIRFYEACLLGKSIKEIATEFLVNADIFNSWARDEDKPEFKDAYTLGKQAAEAYYERIGRENIVNGNPSFREPLYKFITGVRFNWSEKSEQTINNKETPLSDAELEQLIQAKLASMGLNTQNVESK